MKKYSKIGLFQSKGRIFKEAISKYRTPFQRDRDRIIHSAAKHKFLLILMATIIEQE